MTRIPAFERLRELPEVFTTTSLPGLMGTDAVSASVYLARWRKRGLVSSLGERTGVHFNLARNTHAREEHWAEAVEYVVPGAVRGGVTALWSEGWTVQHPHVTHVMAPTHPSFPRIDGVEIHRRPLSWFPLARQNLQADGPLPQLTAAFALADCWKSGHWRPDPDDIEWDLVDYRELERAFEALGTEIPKTWTSDEDFIHWRDHPPGIPSDDDDIGPDP